MEQIRGFSPGTTRSYSGERVEQAFRPAAKQSKRSGFSPRGSVRGCFSPVSLPLAGPKLKGATSVVTKRVVGPAGARPAFHMISDVSFPTLEAMKACASSSGGQEALAHAASISTGGAPTVLALVDET